MGKDEFEEDYDDDELFDDDDDEFEDDEEEEEEEEEFEEEAPPAKAQTQAPAAKATTPTELTAAVDVPLSMTVELGSIDISLSDLMQMKAGNVLSLDTKPSESVNLMINNKCVGKGEIVQIGDVLGIRVLEKA